MNLKEYKAQLALGTVDFRLVANETKSSTVLQDIIGRIDDITVLSAVAINPKSDIYTLTLLATFPSAEEGVVISCAYHPSITLSVLERWMKYPKIECIEAVQRRVRALQLASGVSEKDALVVKETPIELPNPFKGGWQKSVDRDTVIYPVVPNTQKEYVVWTTTGNNVSIELDDNRFKFVNGLEDNTVYFACDSSVSVFSPFSPMQWSGDNES